jgi:hypothetical protein
MMLGALRSNNKKAVCEYSRCAFTVRLRPQEVSWVRNLGAKLNNALQGYDVVTRDVAARAVHKGSDRLDKRGRREACSGKVNIERSTRRKQFKYRKPA